MIYHIRISTKYSIRYQQYSLPFLEKKKLTLTNPKNGNLTHYQNTALPPRSGQPLQRKGHLKKRPKGYCGGGAASNQLIQFNSNSTSKVR